MKKTNAKTANWAWNNKFTVEIEIDPIWRISNGNNKVDTDCELIQIQIPARRRHSTFRFNSSATNELVLIKLEAFQYP